MKAPVVMKRRRWLSTTERRKQQVVVDRAQAEKMRKRRRAAKPTQAERNEAIEQEIVGRETANEYAASGEFEVEAARLRYGRMSERALREVAKEAKLPGYSRMKKPALVEALSQR